MKREHMEAATRLINEACREAQHRDHDAHTQALIDATAKVVENYRSFASMCFGYAVLCWACFIAFVVWKAS